MAAAGAEVLLRTTDHPVMGLPGLRVIVDHAELNDQIEGIFAEHAIDLHVPVDSPAANFPVCRIARRAGARIVHVVAPQMWAWGRWRVRKLRRLTDLVLCLLPFEPAWFGSRRVPATFIGHPIFDEPTRELPAGDDAVVALLPGSRSREFQRVFPLLIEMLAALREDRPGLRAVVGAVSDRAVDELRAVADCFGGWPAETEIIVGDVDRAIASAGLVLACSGTVTLRVMRLRRPMVVVYRVEPLGYALVGKRLLSTPYRALPNLAAGRRIVPEFVPLEGPAAPALAAARQLLLRSDVREQQVRDLDEAASFFESHRSAADAAEHIARFLSVPAP